MSDNLRGAALMTFSMFLYALENMIVKGVAASVPVWQILTMNGVAGALIFAAISHRMRIPILSRGMFSGPVLIRSGAEIFAAVGFVTALSLVPLSTVSAILQALPLVMTVGAAVILHEPVGWRRWLAVLIGFGGVLMIIRPGSDVFDPAALFALMAVAGLGLRDVITRRIPPGISTIQLSTWAFLFLPAAGAILLPFGPAPAMPGLVQIVLLIVALLLGLLGYYTITLSTRLGETAVVAPLRYTRLIFALGLGALAFGERPDAMTLAGAAVIMATGLYTLGRERRRPGT
jgi:drug/metabolite transporter (DMT)-like permease